MLRILEKSIPKAKKSMKNRSRKLENRCLEEVWELLGALGGDLGKENVQEAVLADLARFWTGAGCPKWRQDGRTWRQDGAKMAPRCPRWGLSGHLEADWGVILGILGVLGAIFAEMAEV